MNDSSAKKLWLNLLLVFLCLLVLTLALAAPTVLNDTKPVYQGF